MQYRSRITLLGLPLIDVNMARRNEPGRGVARGWIAIGDIAIGVFALGGLATGGIAVGGLALGVISLAGLAIGAFAAGGAAAGVWAVGGAAFAIDAALGGLAVAAHFAYGGAAYAQHANDAEAASHFSTPLFGSIRDALSSRWILLLLLLPVLLALGGRSKGEADS